MYGVRPQTTRTAATAREEDRTTAWGGWQHDGRASCRDFGRIVRPTRGTHCRPLDLRLPRNSLKTRIMSQTLPRPPASSHGAHQAPARGGGAFDSGHSGCFYSDAGAAGASGNATKV